MQLSDYGEQCIKILEEDSLTPVLKAYDDGGGTWTISWGCTDDVHKGMVCTEAEAEAMFQREIAKHVALVNKHITVPLKQTQFDCCVSFFFNEGVRKSFIKAVNSGDEAAVFKVMMQFVYVGKKKWDGLVKRRTKEIQLWNGLYRDKRITAVAEIEAVNTTDRVKADDVAAKPSRPTVATAAAAVAATATTVAPSLPSIPAPPKAAVEAVTGWQNALETVLKVASTTPGLIVICGILIAVALPMAAKRFA